MGGKDSWCVELINLTPSCDDCLEICEPHLLEHSGLYLNLFFLPECWRNYVEFFRVIQCLLL